MSKFNKIFDEVMEGKELQRVRVKVDPITTDDFANADEYTGYILAEEEPCEFYKQAINYIRIDEGIGGMSLFPGAFKPPHISHYNEALDASQQNDLVYILVDSSPIDNITAEQAVQIWDIYKNHIKGNIIIKECNSIYDTVRAVITGLNNNKASSDEVANSIINEVKDRNLVNVTLHTNDDKFKKLSVLAGNNISNVLLNDVNIESNSQLMRYALKNNDEETFKENLPAALDDGEKDSIWSILKDV